MYELFTPYTLYIFTLHYTFSTSTLHFLSFADYILQHLRVLLYNVLCNCRYLIKYGHHNNIIYNNTLKCCYI